MTLDEICAEARGLTPRAANIALAILPMVGPLPTFWHAALTDALVLVARRGAPLTSDEIDEVLHAAVYPENRTGWLRNGDEFVLAHQSVVNAHLSAEKWKSIFMTLIDLNTSTRH